MISVQHLVKQYGSHLAVDDVSFEVQKGEIVGFLGPNGAGKSTTLRILSGFLGPTSGKVTIAGHDIERDSHEARKALGYMPEAVPLYPEMRVHEYLSFRAELKGVASGKRRSAIDDAMDKAGVFDFATAMIGTLSKGYKQRVGLADALVARPPLLILDEPTAGLDPNQIREVRNVIKGLGAEHTVLLSTHILSEVESSCSKVLLIAKGQLLAEGKTDDIRHLRREGSLEITVRGDAALAEKTLRDVEGVENVTKVAKASDALAGFVVGWSKDTDAEAIATASEKAVAALVGAGLFVREARSTESSLEEVFAALTADAAATAKKAEKEGEKKPAPKTKKSGKGSK
ncbi:MAG TPA: ABC transporter ATP-binding protein [Polyangiaceae bacterium]